MTGDWTAPEVFDPSSYEHGIVCGWCREPLSEGNVMQLDLGPDPDPWEADDQPRVYTFACVPCVVEGAVQRDPDDPSKPFTVGDRE